MSTITIALSDANATAMQLAVDSATGDVVGGQLDGRIKSVNIEEWAKVYPGIDIKQATALDIRDFSYVSNAGEFRPPDWEYRQNRLIKGEISVIDINGYDNYELNPCVLLGADNQPVPYNDPAGICFEACNEDDPNIAIWTVYGHLPEGGVEALVDCPHRNEAGRTCDAMNDQLSMKRMLIEIAADSSLHINARSWAAQSVVDTMRRQSLQVIDWPAAKTV